MRALVLARKGRPGLRVRVERGRPPFDRHRLFARASVRAHDGKARTTVRPVVPSSPTRWPERFVPLRAVSRSLASVILAVVVLAGCGGSPGDDDAGKELTVPAYGPFPAMTVPLTPGPPALCRAKADAFSRAAAAFLRPYPSDADIYRVLARVQFTAFRAHRCDIAVLRKAVSRRLTAKQLREVLAFFGFMGEIGRDLAGAPQH